MEKEKKKISCSYALLVVVLFATVCFLVDYIVIDRKLNENKGGSSTNSNVSENVNSGNVDNNSYVENDNFNSLNRIGKTNLTLNRDTEFIIEIIDGNINIKSGEETATILSNNAKYFHVTNSQGGGYSLFYVTTENKLYELNCDLYDIFQRNLNYSGLDDGSIAVRPILLAENVVDFVDDYENKQAFGIANAYSYSYWYISMITTDNNVNHVYFKGPVFFGPDNNVFIQK